MPKIARTVVLFWLLCGVAAAEPTQMVAVRAHGWNDSRAELQRWERGKSGWVPVGEAIAVVLGAHGIGWGAGLVAAPLQPGEPVKKEGDLRAPAGVFELGDVTGYAASPPTGATLHYRPALDDRLRCVDDASAPQYNQFADAPAGETAWKSDEHMRRQDGLYELTVFVGHNPDRKAGLGSCIFLHVWRAPTAGTAGCTAMPRDDLFALVAWLRADAHPILVQAPSAVWDRLAVAAGIHLMRK